MSTFTLSHPTLGPITLVERSNSRRISARWKPEGLRINVPAGLSASQINNIISQYLPEFEKLRPKTLYADGSRLDFDGGFSVSICYSEPLFRLAGLTDRRILIEAEETSHVAHFSVFINPKFPIGSPESQQLIDKALKGMARHLAKHIIIPRARTLADRLKVKVNSWQISNGKNLLGTCFPSERRINLSYMCVFLPDELRDYIVCHELAHLSEANHSDRFHSVCDRYLDGRESELARKLRTFRWPVLR